MPKWKIAVLFFLCTALLLTSLSLPVHAEPTVPSAPTPPSVSAKSAILIEAESGNCIYEKNADEVLPMASTTKIMTALVALEALSPDTVITIPACAIGTEGSSVYLLEGEQLTLEQLLYALMLESANDAAVAIAVGVAGSAEEFAERMNRKAEALGLSNTRFANPHGLDAEQHYTTARELSVITAHALQNELFRTIVSTRKTTIPHAGTDGARLLVNHNKLLRLYEDCIGVKTGYTSQSGRCLVSAAERDGVTVIAVTLSASDDWNDHQKLLDYGFTQYISVTLCEAGAYTLPLTVVGGADTYVTLSNQEGLQTVLPIDHPPVFVTVEMPRFEYAPIKAGEAEGAVVFRCDLNGDGVTEIIGKVALEACYNVEQKKQKKSFWQWLCSLFSRKKEV